MFKKLFLIFFLGFILLISYTLPQEIIIRLEYYNLYKETFSNPYETVIFVTKNGDVFYFTNQTDGRTFVPLAFLIKKLHEQNSNIEDIIIVIHNHFANPKPTLADMKYLKSLLSYGFHGHFGVYHTPTQTIYWVPYKKSSQSASNERSQT